jgi:hypothetical protein
MTTAVDESTEVEVEPARFARPRTTFEEYLTRSEAYDAAIRDAEDDSLPWHEDPEKLAAMAARLGLTADTDPLAVRKALFDRRYLRPETAIPGSQRHAEGLSTTTPTETTGELIHA